MSTGLGALFQGFQSGFETAQQARRNKRINSLVDRELDEYDLERRSRYLDFINEGGSPEDFPTFDESPDPFLIRGFNWLRDRMGRDRGGQGTIDPSRMVAPQQGIPTDTVPMNYADGGEVNPWRYYRGGAAGGVNRAALPGLGDDTREALDRGANAINAATREFSEAEGARAKGAAARDVVGTSLVSAADAALGFGEDVLIDNPLTQGVLGFLGFEGTQTNPQPAPGRAPAGERKAASVKIPGDKKQALDTGVAAKPSSQQVAAEAVQTGVQNTPGHPDNPDQAFDWAEVRMAGATPDEIPHVGVEDWRAYRQRSVQAAIMRGEDPTSAHQRVTEMQMQGAQANFAQAAYLLKAGQADAAALAARAAYQYFPNGSDVRIGIHNGPNGPVLVGMGYDEVTGEPIMDGKPMVLTPDSLMAISANFSNPEAFMNWTKDWREEERAEREYQEVTKPEAQSEAIYRDRMGRAALQRSEADMVDALTGGGSGSSVRESDLRASYDRIADNVLEQADVDPEDFQTVRELATRMRQRYPSQRDLSDEQIVSYLVDAYRNNDLTGIRQLLER